MRDLSRTINAQSRFCLLHFKYAFYFSSFFIFLNTFIFDSPIDSNRGFKNDLTILRSGRQFITRKLIHGQIVELERSKSY
jgi:hypothetical protein